MKRFRLGIMLALALCACIFVAGCISDSTTDSEDVITIWAYDSSAEIAQEAVTSYQKMYPESDYSFEVVKMGQEDMVEKIKVYLATGSTEILPNIFYDEDYNFEEYITYYGDYFVDVTEHIDSSDYYNFKMVNVENNGRIYAIPYDAGTGVLFYRIDLIQKAGYTEEDMRHLSWDEYISIGRDVKKVTGIDMVTLVPEGDMEGRLLYQSAGTWFFDKDGNANIKDNPGFVSAMEVMKQASDSGIVYKSSSWDDIVSCIANGKIASLIGASWWAPIISSYDNQAGLWRVTEMPKMENGGHYSNLGGGNWFIINKENREIATEFAVEMFSKNQEIANYAANEYYVIPTNIQQSKNLKTENNNFFGNQDIIEFMSGTLSGIPAVKYGLHTYEVTYVVGEYVGDYIYGELTLNQAIDKMHTAVDKVVKSQ